MAVSVRAQLDPTIAAWLLDPAHPTVRRLARTRLGLADEGPSPVPLADEPWIRALITPPDRRRSTRTSSGRASHWRLGSLAELDADPVGPGDRGVRGAGVLARWSGWLEAPGRLARTKPVRGRVRICGSQEGLAAWAAMRLGLADDPRVAGAIERLLGWQWPDGGWNCDKRPEASHSSFNESWGAMRALAVFGGRASGRPRSGARRGGRGSRGRVLPGAPRRPEPHDRRARPPERRRHALAAVLALRPARRAPDAARRGSPRGSADGRRARGPAGRARDPTARGARTSATGSRRARARRPISRRSTGRSTASARCSPSRPWRSSPRPAERPSPASRSRPRSRRACPRADHHS